MTISELYASERQRYLENCVQCGACAEACPILSHTNARESSSQDIQTGVFDFVESDTVNEMAYTKAFACMECFKCTTGVCPEDLNPMLVNEIVKGEYISRGLAEKPYGDPREPESGHCVLASILVSPSEYRRITEPTPNRQARFVFFPGCNVYMQPEKILNALDIMDAVGDDYAFLPGLDHCCGDSHLFLGGIEEGGSRAEDLVAAIAGFHPEAVICWCPTCQCRFDKNITPALDVPFRILSFPQYLAANMDKLPLSHSVAGAVTLHEPCKSAYTGLDLDGPRGVLGRLPGVTLREMEHHGPETVCCGSGASSWFPQSYDRMRQIRMEEAASTGAARLVTVCHYCTQTFSSEESKYDFTVTNYVNLVAEAMGIQRADKFNKYMKWGDLDLILRDAEEAISGSPFDQERIVEVLKEIFIG